MPLGTRASLFKGDIMDIEFIKWMCEKAEGVSYWERESINEAYIDFGQGTTEYPIDCFDDEWEKVYYPLLLQRAIEGVNKTLDQDIHVDWAPISEAWRAELFMYGCSVDLWHGATPDKAKEAALKHIWENEK